MTTTDDLQKDVASLRDQIDAFQSEVSRAAAVLQELETRRDRAERGVAGDDPGRAGQAFASWLSGNRRPEGLGFLTEDLVPTDGGTVAVVDADLSPGSSGVDSLVSDLETSAGGGSVDAAALESDFGSLLAGDVDDVRTLESLFEAVLAAAKAKRTNLVDDLNNSHARDGSVQSEGKLQAFLDSLGDDLETLEEEPVALLPARLETRFVQPNQSNPDPGAAGTTNYNRTEPPESELRIRVYPDQIHVDSHEPELTLQEVTWGKGFWAQLWYACHGRIFLRKRVPAQLTLAGNQGGGQSSGSTQGQASGSSTGGSEPARLGPESYNVWYDETKLPSEVRDRGVVDDLASSPEKFSAKDAARYREIKERAWSQLVDRFGRERAAYVVQALAPKTGAETMLQGWGDDPDPPWKTAGDPPDPPWVSGPAPEPPWAEDEAPDLTFPDVDLRPNAWSRQPRARLLPDRWIAVAHWSHPDGQGSGGGTVRVTGSPIRQPLHVGPDPEMVPGEVEETEGIAPEGMEWMTDYEEAERAGMALRLTADDLGGTDPADVVFDKLVVVGVKSSMPGPESTNGLEDLLDAHHYTHGLELLERGTPTNNADKDSGYTRFEDADESVDVECGPPLTRFGDFSDGDILARALGVASPDGDHVLAHVEGADQRSQATARHMNSVLWPGTMGYYLRNLLVSNRWSDEISSIWAGSEPQGVQAGPEPFPDKPLEALGDSLKWMDAYRRHFVRYVRPGGPFPPIRVDRQPYGVLPVASLPGADDGGSLIDRSSLDGRPVGAVGDPSTPAGGPGAGVSAAHVADAIGGAAGQAGTGGTPSGGRDPGATDDFTVGGGSGLAGAGPSAGADPAGYSMTVAEPPNQVSKDLYGSSFDPAGPGVGGTGAGPGLDAGDGPLTRRKALKVDDKVPDSIAKWLKALGGAWRASWDNVDRVGTGGGPDLLERILQREAVGDDYVREILLGYQGALASHYGDQGDTVESEILEDYPDLDPGLFTSSKERSQARNRALRQMLIKNGLTDLDPRLGWMNPLTVDPPDPPSSSQGGQPLGMSVTQASQSATSVTKPLRDDPAPRLVGPRPAEAARVMYQASPAALRWLGHPWDPEKLTLDQDPRQGDLDPETAQLLRNLDDNELAVYLAVNGPDEVGLDGLVSYVGYDAGNPGQGLAVGLGKMGVLEDTDWAGLQSSLFNQLLRFSTLQAYVGARLRLGLMWNEPLDAEAQRLLSPLSGGGESPIPDPAWVPDSGRTIWDALEDIPPGSAPIRTHSYGEILHRTCSPAQDLVQEPDWTPDEDPVDRSYPPVEPHMRDHLESLRFLEGRLRDDPSDARRLLTETLDLVSHRLDAWWTSLATRRLFEKREASEVDLYEAEDYAWVGDHFRGFEPPSHRDAPESGGQSSLALGNETLVAEADAPQGQGVLSNPQVQAVDAGTRSGGDGDQSPPEPVTYVGAYAFVENLVSDALADQVDVDGVPSSAGGEEAEYVHAPTPDHATTAAILRSGYRNHQGQAVEETLDLNLSPGRVRAAKQVLAGIRQGHTLGDLLGYRFERRLLERTKWYRDQASGAGDFNLVQYKFDFRRQFPAVEGQLDHGGGTLQDPAARSDLVDGYRLLTKWRKASDTAAFLETVDSDDAQHLEAAMSQTERDQVGVLLRELDAIVDAVTDVLLAENVHQLGKGNFDRAGGGLDDLVKGKTVDTPQVAQTPADHHGVSHRLAVVLGDPSNASPPSGSGWTATYPDSTVQPGSVPDVGASLQIPTPANPPYLQVRPQAEPNLDAWLGELLPDPSTVSSAAALTWEEERAVDTGSFSVPTEPGTVVVEDLGFEPDLVVLTAAHAVGSDGAADAADAGWTHGLAHRGPDGNVHERSLSVAADPGTGDAGGLARDDAALAIHFPGGGEVLASLVPTADGFDAVFRSVDLPDEAPEGLEVAYQAFDLGDRSKVEVGTFETKPSTGSQTVDLGVDADHVLLAAATVPTATGQTRTTQDAAGLSRGAASATSPITQHAAGASLDPGGGDPVAGVRDDRALHLVYGTGGSVDGTTSAEVTGLGSSLELQYHSVHAGGAPDGSRVVAYVAVQTPDRVPTPSVGVVDPADVAQGTDEVDVSTGFRPARVELLACPGTGAVGADASAPAAGWSHGLAPGQAGQQALVQVRRPDAGATVGGLDEAASASIPEVDSNGQVTARHEARLRNVDDDGFTLDLPAGSSWSAPLLYRAWPAEPGTVTHKVETGFTLADLSLSPLDAIHVSDPNQEAGASQLELRASYHLRRNPPTRPDPSLPVPGDADVELRFREPSPDASGPDPLPMGGLLETLRALRAVVQEGRPLDAEDLTHPAGADGPGYTPQIAQDMATRARDAQGALGGALDLIDNRVTRLDPESGPALHEKVDEVHGQLGPFLAETPTDGIEAAAETAKSTVDNDPSTLASELRTLSDHLPAGPLDRASVDPDHVVGPLPGQHLELAADAPNQDVDVRVWSRSARDWFEKTTSGTTDAQGFVDVSLDFDGLPLGTPFAVTVHDGADIHYVGTGRVLPPDGAQPVRPEQGRTLEGEIAEPGMKVDVEVTERGAASPLKTATVTSDDDGVFSVEADLDGLSRWTVLDVEATDPADGTPLYQGAAYVEPDPAAAVASAEVLPRLLWLESRRETVDADDGFAAALQEAVQAVDWTGAVADELALMRDFHSASDEDLPAQEDIDRVAALLSAEGSDPGLDDVDLEALEAAVAEVTAPLCSLGLPDLFAVSGRPDRGDGVDVWYQPGDALQDVPQRLAAALGQPSFLLRDASYHGFDPRLEAYLDDHAATVFPQGLLDDPVERFLTYLDALVERLPAVAGDPAFEQEVARPHEAAAELQRYLFHPESFPESQAGYLQASVTDLVYTATLSPLRAIDDVVESAVDAMDDVELVRTGSAPPGPDTRDPGGATSEFERLLGEFASNGLQDYRLDLDSLPSPSTSGSDFGRDVGTRLQAAAGEASTHNKALGAARQAGRFDDALRVGICEGLRRAMLRVSYFGVWGSTPQPATGGGRQAVDDLLAQAEAVRERARERYDEASALAPDQGEDPTVESQVDRLQALFGDDFQVLPPFRPASAAELENTFGRSRDLQGGDPLAAETWLQRVARVRDRPGAFRRALSYTEALDGERHRYLRVGQIPHRGDDLWVGLDGEEPEPGRLSLVAQYGAGFDGSFTASPVAGLFVDEHTENVPTETHQTGVALRYDAPDVTAPQSLLVALPPADAAWTEDALQTVVEDTMELFKIRMVDLEDLDDLGPLAPALCLPRNYPLGSPDRLENIRPDAPGVDLERIKAYHGIVEDYKMKIPKGPLAGLLDPNLGVWSEFVGPSTDLDLGRGPGPGTGPGPMGGI